MRIGFTIFTFDPDNNVALSSVFLEFFFDFINKEIFTKHIELIELYNGWTLNIFISSDADFKNELKVGHKIKKSRKWKEFDIYVYFPKPNRIEENRGYPINEFIIHFCEALNIILANNFQVRINESDWEFIKNKAIKRFFGKKKYIFKENVTPVLTEQDFIDVFWDASEVEIIDAFNDKTIEELKRMFPHKNWEM